MPGLRGTQRRGRQVLRSLWLRHDAWRTGRACAVARSGDRAGRPCSRRNPARSCGGTGR
ncbi:MAG TPA: hypothetical protein VET24_01780 [Actinomycetota bacterium]|nr:hypothetical protein [Actinomycetota bacterium]